MIPPFAPGVNRCGRGLDLTSHFFAFLLSLPSAAVIATDDEVEIGFLAGFDLAHRVAIEFDPVGIVNDPVPDRVAERGLTDNFMPCGRRKSADD